MDLVLVPVHLGMHWCLAVSLFLVIQVSFCFWLVLRVPLHHHDNTLSSISVLAQRQCLRMLNDYDVL